MIFEIIVIGIVFVYAIILVLFNQVDAVAFWVFLLYCSYAAGLYIIMRHLKRKDEMMRQKELETDLDLPTCMKLTNEKLLRMTNSDVITWDGGQTKTWTRQYQRGSTYVPFRAFLGHYSRSGLQVLIRFNLLERDVSDAIESPSPSYLRDPWHDFKPFANTYGSGNVYGNPYARRNRNRGRFTLPLTFEGDDGYDDEPEHDQARDFAREAGYVLDNRKNKNI